MQKVLKKIMKKQEFSRIFLKQVESKLAKIELKMLDLKYPR